MTIRDQLLISTESLARLLPEEDVRVVDVRYGLDDPGAGRRAYGESRLPGAVYLDWIDDLSDPDDPTPGQLAPPERFREAMERAGIDDDTLVVGYDDGIIFMAARLAWCLRVYGHERVRILDGGYPKWVREARPLETSGPPARLGPASFTPRPVSGLRAGKEDVLDVIARGNAVLLDCRMDETWNAAGQHIPGARRLSAPSLVGEDGTVLPAEELAARARAAGASPGDTVVLYCGGGVSASLVFGALSTVGYTDLAVYDGSWSEWAADQRTPRAPH